MPAEDPQSVATSAAVGTPLPVQLPSSTQSPAKSSPYARKGPLRWLRTFLLLCWIVIVSYLGNAGSNLYRLDHADLTNLLVWSRVRDALLLPGPLAGKNTPLWAHLLSAVAFAFVLVRYNRGEPRYRDEPVSDALEAPPLYQRIIIHHLSDLHYQQKAKKNGVDPLVRYLGYLEELRA